MTIARGRLEPFQHHAHVRLFGRRQEPVVHGDVRELLGNTLRTGFMKTVRQCDPRRVGLRRDGDAVLREESQQGIDVVLLRVDDIDERRFVSNIRQDL